jgi:geranylgeranyl transferase type-2 subunit alpha
MTSHGIPRHDMNQEKTIEAREIELKEIEKYRELDRFVRAKMRSNEYTSETLHKTSELLIKNPEYYTIWNYRRLILRRQFSAMDEAHDQVGALVKMEMEFLFPLLRKFPKCYWVWNYRMWLLDEATRRLSLSNARPFWEHELHLVGKMLSLDSRNFHGWSYRRFVVRALDEPPPSSKVTDTQSMAQSEYDYTTRMIKANLSNFSAWHHRTKVTRKLLDERGAPAEMRKEILNEELELIHQALIDPYDQSLWFYHQNLMSAFDPALGTQSIIPGLSTQEQLQYVLQEKETILEMLDGFEDCKWIYYGLIHCTTIIAKIQGSLTNKARDEVLEWLSRLKKLDPLREGRWAELDKFLRDL